MELLEARGVLAPGPATSDRERALAGLAKDEARQALLRELSERFGIPLNAGTSNVDALAMVGAVSAFVIDSLTASITLPADQQRPGTPP